MSSRLLALSDGFYQVLLQLYPRSFRKRFAVEMSQVFRALCREVYAESGAGGSAAPVAAHSMGLGMVGALPMVAAYF